MVVMEERLHFRVGGKGVNEVGRVPPPCLPIAYHFMIFFVMVFPSVVFTFTM